MLIIVVLIGHALVDPRIAMGVGRFLDFLVVPGIGSVVRPDDHVGKHMLFFHRTLQHTVDERHGLGTGDGLIGTEAAVRIAVDPAKLLGQCDVCLLYTSDAAEKA